ncbi:MAG: hypothetical protein ABFS34_15310 [Gemmatimonadota bacterium]
MRGRPSHLGVALSGDRVLSALVTARGRPLLSPLTRSARLPEWGGEEDWPALADYLAGLRSVAQRGGPDPLPVVVALCPPICDWRLLRLPRLGQAETHALLEAHAARYFLNAPDHVAVSIGDLAPMNFDGAYDLAPPRLCAVADGRLLAAIRRAAKDAGLANPEVVPAASAWARAIRNGRGGMSIVVAGTERTGRRDVVWGHQGRVTRLRAWPVRARTGLAVRPRDAAAALPAGVADDALLLAAVGGSRRTHGAFLTAPMMVRLRRTRARTRIRAIAAGLLLFLGAAAIHHAGLGRRLEGIRGDRASIAEHVQLALEIRAEREAALATAATLDSLDGVPRLGLSALEWVADRLPRDAFLTGATLSGDTLTLSGEGADLVGLRAALIAGECRAELLEEGPKSAGSDRTAFRLVLMIRPCVAGGET